MPNLLAQYLPLVIFMAVAAVISAALAVAPFLLAFKAPDTEKLSAYECGFNAFDDARMKFDVRFYLVSLLFIIFDLEVAFLVSLGLGFKAARGAGFWAVMVFLGVLTIGFVYEWKKGALGMGLTPVGTGSGTLVHPATGKPVRPMTRLSGDQQRARRQGHAGDDRRRSDHLGAHRLADVDDFRPRLLRGRNDAGLHAAL